jgi:hypothetical protein
VAPLPEDLPGGDEFLDNSGCGEIEEAAAIGGLAVAFFNHIGAEKSQVALEVFELLPGHGVVWEISGALCHGTDATIFALCSLLGHPM